MELEKIVDLLKIMSEQFVQVMQNNNKLLEENLRLWKENSELRKELKKDGSNGD